MFIIAGWKELYEVNEKGRPVSSQDEKLRANPLDYIRLRNHGRSKGLGFRRMEWMTRDKKMTWDTFGKFCKMLEIAGSAPGGQRGILLNEKGQPASVEDLAFLFDVPITEMQFTMDVLCDRQVHWVHDTELAYPEPVGNSEVTDSLPAIPATPEISGNSRNLPEKAGTQGKQPNPQNQTKNADSPGFPGISRKSPESPGNSRKKREPLLTELNRTELNLKKLSKPKANSTSGCASASVEDNKKLSDMKSSSVRPENKTKINLLCQKFSMAAVDIIRDRWPRSQEQLVTDATDLQSLGRYLATECPDIERLSDQLTKLMDLLREKADPAHPRLNLGSFFAAAKKRWPGWRKSRRT